MRVLSTPHPRVAADGDDPIEATIDWGRIEELETLDDVAQSDAVQLRTAPAAATPGTQIELAPLRRRWTDTERTRIVGELTAFQPPPVLLQIDPAIHRRPLLFDQPMVRDIEGDMLDPGFEVRLEGDFDVGEAYWSTVAAAADWILEVRSEASTRSVKYLITPTTACLEDLPEATQENHQWSFDSDGPMPTLTARILIREGSKSEFRKHTQWFTDNAGVKVFMEGFRVLPYGERSDDWLELDYDYAQRSRKLRFLEESDLGKALDAAGDDDADAPLSARRTTADAPLSARRTTAYFGGVFLTLRGSQDLEMLVNREGFLPNAAFDNLHRIVRVGIDLSVRAAAFARRDQREERRQERKQKTIDAVTRTPERMRAREEAEAAAQRATDLAAQARTAVAAGRHEDAQRLLGDAIVEARRSTGATSELMSDRSIMQILAGVGLQMSAFVHEMNGLLGMASAVEAVLQKLTKELILDAASRRALAEVRKHVEDLRRAIERQASYLSDITSPDARRRRSRQSLRDRFDAAVRLVARAAEGREIIIDNAIPDDLRSPPMYPAELAVVFTNLLTNAVKACETGGRIRATGKAEEDGSVCISVQNTGQGVGLADAEQWFIPFRTTTVGADPVLGQGMGMGLPIARNILEEYGATIAFSKPSRGFATALEIRFKTR